MSSALEKSKFVQELDARASLEFDEYESLELDESESFELDEPESLELYEFESLELSESLVIGENGMAAEATTKKLLLDLFFYIVRDSLEGELKDITTKILKSVRDNRDVNLLCDLIVLIFQTRDCRGGKGEKKLFYLLLLELNRDFPETLKMLLVEIPTYGYFKDFILIMEMISTLGVDSDLGDLKGLSESIINIFVEQLRKDEKELNESLPKLSFAGKYAPREGKQYDLIAKKLARKLYPESRTPNKDYRKLLSKLTEKLNVPEVLMCARRYHEIDFKHVPSLCANRFRKAFLNELIPKKGSEPVPLSESEQETGNRHPDDPHRVQCRKNLQIASVEGKVCGKVLLPHELVSQLMRNSKISSFESSLYDAQWAKIKEGVLEGIAKFISGENCSAINLGKLVPLVDVSGSMSGTPMDVAVALGILVSELSDPAFKDRFITFEESPKWVSLEGLTTLKDKVVKTQAASWGGSTNFESALEMILEVAVKLRLKPEEIPDMIVFSDMQFNQAGRYGDTMHAVIQRRFAEAGVRICGTPYKAPKIIYWNLRGNTTGFPVDAYTPNTQMISGFSPSLLKLLLDGEPLVIEETTEDGKVIQREVTPEETLRKALDDKRYDPIREILSKSQEGILSEYTFERPPVEA
jgi:hypothetical protein